MSDLIRVRGRYYIAATSSLADDRTRVLKHGDTFAIFDRFGDIEPVGLGEQGIYCEGARHLSHLLMRTGPSHPLLLSSTVHDNNIVLAVHLTNLDDYQDGELRIPRGTVHLSRSKFLWNATCYERIELSNHGLRPVQFSFAIEFAADFADIFEVRGFRRASTRVQPTASVGDDWVLLVYEGQDDVTRSTGLTFSPRPQSLSKNRAEFSVTLEPQETQDVDLTIVIGPGKSEEAPPFPTALASATAERRALQAADCQIITSNEQFNNWVNRSLADLRMMGTETPHGRYPYAGVPWFNTPFGRDGLITALEMLWVNPNYARGVLSYLAATQSQSDDPSADAEPGKILHETRKGELAALGEIPFSRYYGTVDATPLFIMLAGAYHDATADRDFVKSIWPNLELALRWIDERGDLDGDGFVEYRRRSGNGLLHQGWKDSDDAIVHADGTLAEGPIALCEVQAYVYEAKLRAGELALVLGKRRLARELGRQALDLQRRFDAAFWCEDFGSYALALDGDKRPCRVLASNAGHCLFTEIATGEHARRVAAALMSDELFSGWGIRTLGSSETRYNPMGYHTGSVWPHDNALIARGLANYGYKEMALRILGGLFDASMFVELQRLPELFCGFTRLPGEGPTLYPVACSPQSWAAGAVFLLLQACLGLTIDAPRRQVRFIHPVLPPFLERVEISNLRVGAGDELDLELTRYPADVGVNVTRRQGNVEVVATK